MQLVLPGGAGTINVPVRNKSIKVSEVFLSHPNLAGYALVRRESDGSLRQLQKADTLSATDIAQLTPVNQAGASA